MRRGVSLNPRPQWLQADRRRRALIGMTPLIDVVFILLVFFMLASSFLDWRSIDLRAPVQAGSGPTGASEALLIEVASDGLSLAGRTVSLEELVPRLDDLIADDVGRPVWIRPAAGVSLQETVAVLDRLAGAGITNLTLIRAPQS